MSFQKEGFLKKDPGLFGGTKRWFVLNPEGKVFQSFEKSGTTTKIKESLDLEIPDDVTLEIVDEKKKIFKIGTKKVAWKLQCETTEEMNAWVDLLKKFLAQVQKERVKKLEERRIIEEKKKEEDLVKLEERKKQEEEKKKQEETRKKREEKKKKKLDSDSDESDDEPGGNKDIAVVKKGAALDSDDEKPVMKKVESKKLDSSDESDGDTSDDKDDDVDIEDTKIDPSTVEKPTTIKIALDQMETFVIEEAICERAVEFLERKFDSDASEFNQKFLDNGGIQTLVSCLEIHYKNETINKFSISCLLPLLKKSEENQHLCRMMNGLTSITNVLVNQEKDGLNVPLCRDIMAILAVLVKKKNDYTNKFMKDTVVLTKICEYADLLARRSFEFAMGFSDFVSNLCQYEGNAQILYTSGAMQPLIKAIKKHVEEKYEILMTFYQFMVPLRQEDLSECAKQFASECSEIVVLQIMSKYDRDVTVLKIVSGIFQKLSFSDDIISGLIKIHQDNEDDAAVALNVSYIFYHLCRVQKDVTQEVLSVWEKCKLVSVCCKMMNLHKAIGWLMNYCISFVLYMIEKKEDHVSIDKEFAENKGFEGVYYALMTFKTSDEVAAVCVRLLDILSQTPENVKAMKKAVGFLQVIMDYIMHVKGTPDSLVGFAILARYVSQIELEKEQSQEMIGFLLKHLDEQRNEGDISARALEVFYQVVKKDPFEIEADEARMLGENIKNNSEDNEDYLKNVLLFSGAMANLNKNRDTFSKHGILAKLKDVWKKAKDQPEIYDEVKEVVKTLGL